MLVPLRRARSSPILRILRNLGLGVKSAAIPPACSPAPQSCHVIKHDPIRQFTRYTAEPNTAYERQLPPAAILKPGKVSFMK